MKKKKKGEKAQFGESDSIELYTMDSDDLL